MWFSLSPTSASLPLRPLPPPDMICMVTNSPGIERVGQRPAGTVTVLCAWYFADSEVAVDPSCSPPSPNSRSRSNPFEDVTLPHWRESQFEAWSTSARAVVSPSRDKSIGYLPWGQEEMRLWRRNSNREGRDGRDEDLSSLAIVVVRYRRTTHNPMQ